MHPTKAKIKELHARGFTVLEMSRELRISPQAVYQHLKDLGLEPIRSEARA